MEKRKDHTGSVYGPGLEATVSLPLIFHGPELSRMSTRQPWLRSPRTQHQAPEVRVKMAPGDVSPQSPIFPIEAPDTEEQREATHPRPLCP